VVVGDLAVTLRAERAGTLTDRAYSITVRCTDHSGDSAQRVVRVTVPHDQRK